MSGLTTSLEKIVVDTELLYGRAASLTRLEASEDDLAIDEIGAIAPGGHFFGAAHAITRVETTCYCPLLSDWRNFETWRDTGPHTATGRAQRIRRPMLTEYVPPPLDPAVDEALYAHVNTTAAGARVPT